MGKEGGEEGIARGSGRGIDKKRKEEIKTRGKLESDE